MPYNIQKSGSQWCVYKDDDNRKMGCHNSEAKAKKQLAALYTSENAEVGVEEWENAMRWVTDLHAR